MTISLPPTHVLRPILYDEDACLIFLQAAGVFYTTLRCPACSDEMPANFVTGRFRCCRRSCNTVLSVRSHTFFFGSHLRCCQIMHLGYLWLNKNGQTQAMNATGCSKKTITTFYSHFRSLVATTLDEDDSIIGGPGIEVQIDETKLGKHMKLN